MTLSFDLDAFDQSTRPQAQNPTGAWQLEDANHLVADAAKLLSGVDDLFALLTALTQLVVPRLADICIVYRLQADGTITQEARAPTDPGEEPAAYGWLHDQLRLDEGLASVFQSGKPLLVTEASATLLPPAGRIPSYMIVPLVSRAQPSYAILFAYTESGRRFDRSALALAENIAMHTAGYLDQVQMYHASQQLYAELEQRLIDRTTKLSVAITQLKQTEATNQTLFRISNKLNSTLEVDTILDELAQEAIRMVNGESGFAGLRTPRGMMVRKVFMHGVASPFTYTWPPGTGIPGWVLVHKVPYGNSDAANDPVMQHELLINTDVQSIICTPILDSVGEVLGYFDIRNKKGGEGFTIDDQEMLMSLAPVASIAIQNALAYQQRLATVAELKESSRRLKALAGNLESAREEERTNIARELHDQLGQTLTAMKFDLASLTNRLEQRGTTLAHKAKAITAQVDVMIKTVRRIASELRPGMLDDLGLAASIEWQARDFEKRTGIECVVSLPAEEFGLERNQSVALFRIFQEALTNVARHAAAQKIEILLTFTSSVVMLQMLDNGRGIKASEIASRRSLGLLGMRERAERAGGTFEIQRAPNNGTLVTVFLPVSQKEDPNLAPSMPVIEGPMDTGGEGMEKTDAQNFIG